MCLGFIPRHFLPKSKKVRLGKNTLIYTYFTYQKKVNYAKIYQDKVQVEKAAKP